MGGGGGGNAGKISLPDYITNYDSAMLGHYEDWTSNNVDVVTDVIAARDSNPFTGKAPPPVDPDILTETNAHQASLKALDVETKWNLMFENFRRLLEGIPTDPLPAFFSEDTINGKITQYRDEAEHRRDQELIPELQKRFSDINAINSSAFAIAVGNVEAFTERDINNFSANLKLKFYELKNRMEMQVTQNTLSSHLGKEQIFSNTINQNIDARKIKYVMSDENTERTTYYDEQASLWHLNLYQFANNAMAAGSGGVGLTRNNAVSPARSVLGTTLSSAAMGAQIGGPSGALIGAYIGFGLSMIDQM
jgi:hypothetical protein